MDITPFHQWFSISFSGLLSMLVNIAILKREITIRKRHTILFASQYLKQSSILCMISSILFGFGTFVRYFDIFCHISWPILLLGLTAQSLFMGFYQLSRLYYCFSQTKIHSTNGYPTCLFICFVSFGCLLLINTLLYPWIIGNNLSSCGINNHYNAYRQGNLFDSGTMDQHWMNLSVVMFLLWDWATLFLYVRKAITFRKYRFEKTDVYNRVQSILVRVLMLTLFYEVIIVLAAMESLLWSMMPFWIADILYNVLWSLVTVFINISMFLMQQHNSKQYVKFLTVLYRTKLYLIYCGCCYKSIIQYELNAAVVTKDRTSVVLETMAQSNVDSTYDTHDISQDHGRIKRPRALSPQTETTIIVRDE
eukprot:1100038_1